ncbi:MAG: lysophospholipid acyltransferase family protein [Melioribacteraceae bacterium]|nr:lysophospholipid acyltransferase family protein [Melioribacteraceae bacterium]
MIDKNKLEFFLFRTFAMFFHLIGINNSRKTTLFLAWFLFKVLKIRKEIVLKNLRTAFPELLESDIQKLALENYRNILMTLIELMFIEKFSRQDVLNFITDGEQYKYQNLVNEGKPVFLLTAHFGNWEIAGLIAGMLTDRIMYGLYKEQRNNYITDYINRRRTQFGNKVIPLGTSVKEIFRVLKNNGTVGVVGDQRGPREGMRVKFFDQPTAIYSGTASIAIKLNVPILVSFAARTEDNKFKIFMEEIEYQNLSGTTDEIIKQINQKYFNLLEKIIKVYPAQWFWMHNIWKY